MSAEDCLPVNVELLQTLYVQYVRACSVLDCTCVLQSSTHVHSNMSGLISGVHGHFALCRNAALTSMVPLSIYGLLLTGGHPVIRSTYRMTRGDCKSSGTDSFSPADRMRLTAPAANIVGL